MRVLNKEQAYISFLEAIVHQQDAEHLLNKTFEILSKTFNAERIQIWESLDHINEFSILHELCEDTNLPMIKLRVHNIPDKTKKVFDNIYMWEYLNIQDDFLTKYNIFSLLGLNFQIKEDKKGLLILTSSKKNTTYNSDEITFLIKLKTLLEAAILKNEKYNRAIDQLYKLQNQNNKLREQNRVRTNFINNISHEIRTPLASITGFSKILISKKQSPEESKETADQIQQAANRLYNLISDFLQINKIDSENWLVHCEPCDVGELIKNTVDEFSSLYKEHKISYKIIDNYPIIHTDSKLFRQVLDNLVSNAIKYSPGGGAVTISLTMSQDKKELMISVSDIGVGIEREEIPQIFNRFYRSHNPDIKNISGSGLGLSICKEIVTSLNGRVNVESIIKKGSQFTVILPIN